MVYILPRNRARSLVQASRVTPPLRGSRRDQGGARSRAGGGQTRRPVSDDQRHYRRRGGGYWLAPPSASAFACRLGFCDSPSRGATAGPVKMGRAARWRVLVGPPLRISLRLSARLLRLPLKGGNCRACKDGQGGEVAGIGWPPHRISLRLSARLLRLPLEGGVIPAVLTDDILDTLDREHGLRLAQVSGKEACAGLKNHSPLEGESARPGRSPQSSRWGGTRRPVSDDQRHYRRRAGGGQTPRPVSGGNAPVTALLFEPPPGSPGW